MIPIQRAILRPVHVLSARNNFTRSASAVWKGNFADGKGEVKTGSGKVNLAYTVPMRFGSDAGTLNLLFLIKSRAV